MRIHSRQSIVARSSDRGQRGMTLVEVMLAGFVLAVGLAGLAVLFTTAAASARGTRLDTNATLVAKLVLEQIAAQDPIAGKTPISITDCGGNAQTINVVGGDYPGKGATINTTSGSLYYGGIDFLNEAYATPAANNYAMKYQDCGTDSSNTKNKITYDVRWNIINFGKDASGNVTTRMITVAAKQYGVAGANLGRSYFMLPVNLRAVEGPTQ
jgi:type II secretory pathway pseudopilin PulG